MYRHTRFTLLRARQDGVETITITPSTSIVELQGAAQTDEQTSIPRLEPAVPPLQLPDTVGLIMPNPWSELYVGINYTLGFVDVVPRPAPTIGGWLRQIQPLLMLPDRHVNIFPSSGTSEVGDEDSIPPGSEGLCGFTAEKYAISYPFVFIKPGWYMFILNQTLLQPTITSDNKCQDPIVSQDTFFATQSFSVGYRPSDNVSWYAPVKPYTVYANVSTNLPGNLPIDPQATTGRERLAVGLGVAAGILAVAGMICSIWWLRRRRRYEAEVIAFNRLSESDKVAFLADNPDSWLNPNHPRHQGGQGVYSDKPPAPPGTIAYAQWYWTHLMRTQPRNPPWPPTNGYQQGYSPGPQYAYQPQMGQVTNSYAPNNYYQHPGGHYK